MIMIPHQTVGQDLHPPPGMTVAQQLEKSLIVRSVGKHRLAGGATIHHMIDGARIGNTQGTSHAATIAKLSPPCNNRLDPFGFGSRLVSVLAAAVIEICAHADKIRHHCDDIPKNHRS